jgi:tRNA(Ile)-lysidine synthase
MQLPCEVVRAEEIPTSEAAARQWRYQVFTSLADVHHCQRIVTGHTATDRAETLLYNLMRGSGADGLQALGWSRPVSPQRPDILLIRPLLGVTRQETGAFCQTYDIPTWDDRTNCDRTYARNRIRLDLMPYIAANFNPSVERTLAQTAELLTAEVDYLEHVAAEIYQSAVNLQAGTVQIQRRALGTVHLAIQRRVLRRALQAITAGEITFDHVEKLVALIHAPNRSQSDPFPGGAIAQVRGDWIAIGGSRNGEQPN